MEIAILRTVVLTPVLPLYMHRRQDMPRDEFTADAFFKGFTEGWTSAGGNVKVGSCPVPDPHFDGVEYLIDQVWCR